MVNFHKVYLWPHTLYIKIISNATMIRGLYIHIPFCNSICPYCNFYSEKNISENTKEQYVEALIKEIASLDNNVFDTIYIGGGTPSSLSSKLLNKLIDNILKYINYKEVEWTIEANPESVDNDFILFIKNSPISRISLGVQSLDNEVLSLLGRIHDKGMAEKSINNLLSTQKDLNIDMIYDIPYTSEEKSIATLNKIISFHPAHISAYSYDYTDTGYLKDGYNEEHTLFEEIEKICYDAGYYKYETSNFALEGKHSKHNCIYWQAEEYIGVGVASHSMVFLEENKRKRYNHKNNIEKYIKDPYTIDNQEIISSEDALIEDIIFGLRMKQGVNLYKIKQKYKNIDKILLNKIDKNIKYGLLEKDGVWLKTTLKGSIMLESVSCSLLP